MFEFLFAHIQNLLKPSYFVLLSDWIWIAVYCGSMNIARLSYKTEYICLWETVWFLEETVQQCLLNRWNHSNLCKIPIAIIIFNINHTHTPPTTQTCFPLDLLAVTKSRMWPNCSFLGPMCPINNDLWTFKST